MYLKFLQRVSEREPAIRQFVIVKNKFIYNYKHTWEPMIVRAVSKILKKKKEKHVLCFSIELLHKTTGVVSRMPFSDWLSHSLSILWYIASSVAGHGALVNKWRTLLGVFEVSVKEFKIKFWTTSRFILKQLDYSLSISTCDSWLGLRSRQIPRDGNLELIT